MTIDKQQPECPRASRNHHSCLVGFVARWNRTGYPRTGRALQVGRSQAGCQLKICSKMPCIGTFICCKNRSNASSQYCALSAIFEHIFKHLCFWSLFHRSAGSKGCHALSEKKFLLAAARIPIDIVFVLHSCPQLSTTTSQF